LLTRSAVAIMVLCSCAGEAARPDAAAVPPETPLLSTFQDELSEDAFWAAASGDTDLLAIRSCLEAAGFATFVAAGDVGYDGARLDFAAYSDGSGAVRAAVRHCASDACVRAIAEEVEGVVRWHDCEGAEVEVRPVPLPYLLRELAIKDSTTTLVSPLTAEPVDLGAIDLSQRRLMVFNQFGPTTGLGAAELLPDGVQGFYQVVLDDHAQWEAVRGAMLTAYPHEVMVWAGQPIRQLYKQSVKQGMPPYYKTVAMAAASGLYGIRRVTASEVRQAFLAAPFSGPGVVVLVGSESLGDGTPGMKVPSALARELDIPGKVVAGFQKDAHPAVLVAATKEFLARLFAGASAGEARDRANALLSAWGVEARLSLTDSSDAAFHLPPTAASFWGGQEVVAADMKLYLHMRLWCETKPGGPYGPVEEKEGNPGFADMSVSGPVFKGHMERQYGAGPDDVFRADIEGVLGEIRQGAHFFFVYSGDVKTGYMDMKLYANAEITKVEQDDSNTNVYFKGSVESLPFTGSEGKQCELRESDLEPLVEGTLSSVLTLKR